MASNCIACSRPNIALGGLASIVFFVLVVSYSCNDSEARLKTAAKSVAFDRHLSGKWVKENSYFKSITFDDTSYAIELSAEKVEKFTGFYRIEGNRIHFVDVWCGWRFPATYEFKIAKNTLWLTSLKDETCDRNKYFPGPWKKENDSAQVPDGPDFRKSVQYSSAEGYIPEEMNVPDFMK